MKSALMKVGMTSLGALILSLCGGCMEGRAENEVPVANPLPALAAIEAPTAVTAPANPAEEAEDADEDLPVVPAKVAVISQTNTVSTNALKLVQEVTPPESMKTSPAVQDIVKLAQAGVGDDVMLSYVTNSTRAYSLTSDEIVYLTDLGVSSEVITALMQKSASAPIAVPTANPAPSAPALAGVPITNVYPGQAGINNNGLPPGQQYPPEQAEAPLTPPANYVEQPTTTSFYSSLAPYGNWVEVPDYGMVWQPAVTVVDAGWRPYCDRGRWVWTDCGWYWQSDYSWGWAPFHYGRWCTYPRLGWIWVPGTEWGPSWVSWRSTSSYCGWAPLPPFFSISIGFNFGFGSHHRRDWDRPRCWTFVDHHRFTDPHPRRWMVGARDAVVIHRTSLVQDHFSYDQHQRLVNTGFGKRPIEKAIGADLRAVTIHETTAVPMGGQRADRLMGNGSAILAVKPIQQHATIGNSLQATRAAAFAAAPVARTPYTPIVTKNTAGSATVPSSNSRPRAGGYVKGNEMAKADVPQVPRTPASRTPQSSASIPAITPTAPQPPTRGAALTPPIVNGSQSRGRQGTPKPTPMQSQAPAITKQVAGQTAVNNIAATPAPVRTPANPFATPSAWNRTAPQNSIAMRGNSQYSPSAPSAGTGYSAQQARVAPLVPGPSRSFARTDTAGNDSVRSAPRSQFSGNRPGTLPPAMSSSPTFAPIPPGVGSSVRSAPAPVYRPEPSRSYSAPAPQYSAPVHSAPAYSAPVHSAPAPQYSAPVHSAPAAAPSSHSSGSSGGGGNRKDR